MPKLGPFSVGFPVNFRSGGDMILTAIDANAADADGIGGIVSGELKKHIDAENPHPNWKPSLSFSDITGYISANQIRENSIPAGKISGLSELIGGQLPPDKGDGITSSSLQEKGYVKFNNGLIVNWGREKITEPYGENVVRTVSFSQSYSESCFNVPLTYVHLSGSTDDLRNFMPQLLSKHTTYFNYKLEQADMNNVWDEAMAIEYISIGY